jgi:hypothetical protein
MAHIEHLPGGRVIVPETPAEAALLQHGLRHRQLVLRDAYYHVQPFFLMLPAKASEATAAAVCCAFEDAAIAHERAQERRRRFHLET